MTRRRLLGAGAAIGMLVLLTGCNLSSRIVVQPDGSGSYSVTMSVPSGSSNAGRTLYQTARQESATSAIPVTVSPYTSGSNSGFRSTFAFKSLADLEDESQAMAATQAGGLAVSINRDASGWHFTSSTANLLAPSTAFGAAANGSTGGPISGTSLQSALSVSVVLQLPGAPAGTNATTVTHSATTSTFTWSMKPGQAASELAASTTFVGNQGSVALSTGTTKLASAASKPPAAAAAAGASHAHAGGSGLSTIWMVAGAGVLVLAFSAVVVRRQLLA
jgi:hypothetical protein